mmetsp:Transcript_5054/g.11453  ORF Transcript_5054/g.11453 Transcript_5054/m.11453 type:complete len:218 (-) Transcript_5054:482-1135(-)
MRTPVTFARMLIPAAMASISRVRNAERSSHSDFFRLQELFVSARLLESASKSSSVFFKSVFAAKSAADASPRAVLFAVCAVVAAVIALSRAFFASSYALIEFVSALVPSRRSSSNFAISSLRRPMTVFDLNVYFAVCFSKSPAVRSSSDVAFLALLPAKPLRRSKRCEDVSCSRTNGMAASFWTWAKAAVLSWADSKAERASPIAEIVASRSASALW